MPVLVSAGTYTCDVVVVVVAGICDVVWMLAVARPTEGPKVIGFELVGRLTRLVITWTGVAIGFKVEVGTGVIFAKLLLEAGVGFLLIGSLLF